MTDESAPVDFFEVVIPPMDLESIKQVEKKSSAKKKQKKESSVNSGEIVEEVEEVEEDEEMKTPLISNNNNNKEAEREDYANLIQQALIELGGKGTVHSVVEWITNHQNYFTTANRKQLTSKYFISILFFYY